jgi:hypothetical protein
MENVKSKLQGVLLRLRGGVADVAGRIFRFDNSRKPNNHRKSIAIPKNYGKFKELPSRSGKKVLPELDVAYLNFVVSHCAKKFQECDSKSVTDLSDREGIFVAKSEYAPDVTVECAKRIGFILPDNIDERVKENPKLMVRPLIVRCYGVGSGKTCLQVIEAGKNVTGVKTDVLATANAIVLSHIGAECGKHDGKDVLPVPCLMGFSFGAVPAICIGVKNKIMTVVFNPLGCGPSVCDFVGQENWDLANGEHYNSHTAITAKGDFASSKMSPLRNMVKIPGRVIVLDNGGLGPIDTHCEFKKILLDFMLENQNAMLGAIGAAATA